MASGDTARFLPFVPDMSTILDNAVTTFLKPGLNVGWFGWDDRVGNGFCGTCNQEAQLAFAALVVRSCSDFSRSLAFAGQTAKAASYNATSARLATQLRAYSLSLAASPAFTGTGTLSLSSSLSSPSSSLSSSSPSSSPWYAPFGLHAAANLVNAKMLTAAEERDIFSRLFNDTVTLCSWSPFNQYWILQALGNRAAGGGGEAEAGEEDGHDMMEYALASIRLCWGGMTTLGKGCLWEL